MEKSKSTYTGRWVACVSAALPNGGGARKEREHGLRKQEEIVPVKYVFLRPKISVLAPVFVRLRNENHAANVPQKRVARLLIEVSRNDYVFAAARFAFDSRGNRPKLRKAERREFFVRLPRPERTFQVDGERVPFYAADIEARAERTARRKAVVALELEFDVAAVHEFFGLYARHYRHARRRVVAGCSGVFVDKPLEFREVVAQFAQKGCVAHFVYQQNVGVYRRKRLGATPSSPLPAWATARTSRRFSAPPQNSCGHSKYTRAPCPPPPTKSARELPTGESVRAGRRAVRRRSRAKTATTAPTAKRPPQTERRVSATVCGSYACGWYGEFSRLPAAIFSTYFASMSNSRLTNFPALQSARFVTSSVCGMSHTASPSRHAPQQS